MARRRLGPVPAGVGAVPHAERGPRPLGTSPAATAASATAPAPIAHVAGDAATVAAFEELAETLQAAREGGRMVLDIPLAEIAVDHLVRDRLTSDDEEMTALKESIRAHGQRTPIDVTPLAGPLPYGLISGWRRLAALGALHAETGEQRFGVARALVTRPESAGAAYVAMVEENEIRVGLSQYERARVALLAAERGVFPDEETALRRLFAGASKAKLSRIRAFMELHRALDGVLRFPRALPERLGLALVERLRAGRRAGIVEALAAADPAAPEAELACLQALVAAKPAEPAPPEEILPGVTLQARRDGRTPSLMLKGRGVTPDVEAAVRAALAALRAG